MSSCLVYLRLAGQLQAWVYVLLLRRYSNYNSTAHSALLEWCQSVDAEVHAIDDYNSSPCSAQTIRPSSQVTGNWQQTTASSYKGAYLTLSVNRNDIASAAAQSATVTMVPFVPESGFYKLYMSIPGCQNTNTCISRTSAKVTWLMNGKNSIVTTIKQHNLVDDEVE
ncbi:hypothetical protein IW136_005641, partial [Coemansia sp. RSA 678]